MPTSDISVSSSQYRRRVKRAKVLQKIIYLKRRCIRCYLVNVFFSIIFLAVAADTMINYYPLIHEDQNLYDTFCLFLSSTIFMLVGSVLCIFALTKTLQKYKFFVGKLLMTVALILILVAVIIHYTFDTEEKKVYGYPPELVEDCSNYPDHTFAFVESPERLKGTPVDLDADEDEKPLEQPATYNDSDLYSSTTELVVTKSYICEDTLNNVWKFRMIGYAMIIFLIISIVTVCLSYLGIYQLCWIDSKGTHYSVLPPALVEPYEPWFYTALLKRRLSNDSFHLEEDGSGQYNEKAEPKNYRKAFGGFSKKNRVDYVEEETNIEAV